MIKHFVIFFLFTAAVIPGCKDAPSNFKSNKADTTQVNMSSEVDKSFDSFISRFSRDSLFQISRIRFPMQVQELELSDSSEMISRTLNKGEHRTMDFSPPKFKDNIDNYTQKFKTDGNRTTIEVRGIDNGMMMDFFFEKIDGKWMLISWTDSST